MSLVLPDWLYYWLWFSVILALAGTFRIFTTKPRLRTIREEQVNGVVGLISGLVILFFLLGWIK